MSDASEVLASVFACTEDTSPETQIAIGMELMAVGIVVVCLRDGLPLSEGLAEMVNSLIRSTEAHHRAVNPMTPHSEETDNG